MAPTLVDGDYVITTNWLLKPRPEKVVVVQHEQFGIIVKRVAKKLEQGFLLKSDNVLGSRTEDIGIIRPERLLGTVLFSVRRKKGQV